MLRYLFEIFGFKVPMYGLCIAIGIVLCMVVLHTYCKKNNIDSKFADFVECSGYIVIVFGWFFAALTQSIYNYIENPSLGFHINGEFTFIGGLIGGVGSFLLIYYLYGVKKYGKSLHKILPIAPCCILIAHACGRLGCFCAGCCYGKETTSWLGMYFRYGDSVGTKVYPTQLFEACFLLLLFSICLILVFKKNFKYSFSVYLLGYGTWRFLIEFLRGDDRGSFIGSISPSQFWSIMMLVLAIPLYFLMKEMFKRIDSKKIEIKL